MKDESLIDGQLTKLLQADPLPEVPNLERATRQRLRQRVTQQVVVRSAALVACGLLLVGALQFLPPFPHDPQPQVVASPLDNSELASLFAPPPVDPLALLDRQQQVAVQTLRQWERNR